MGEGQCNCKGDKNKLLAELKVLRMLQIRVNEETVDVDGRVAVTASRQILLDIGHNQGPEKSLFALGYAGWGPGQLDGELARNNWFTTPEEPKLVFDDDREKLWEDAMARRTREL